VNDSINERAANCVMKNIKFGDQAHLCLFVAGTEIKEGEELCYWYGPTDEHMFWRKVIIQNDIKTT
jgi:SET domain-containing protein